MADIDRVTKVCDYSIIYSLFTYISCIFISLNDCLTAKKTVLVEKCSFIFYFM